MKLLYSIVCAVALMQYPTLDVVLQRAANYVKEYEAQLGSLIAVEDYVQNAAWRSGRNMITRRQQRRLSSDFLILKVGPEWIGVRNVNRSDGFSVKRRVEDFKQVFDDSPAAVMKTLQGLAEDSARYNIGDIRRNINLPTVALLVLREDFFPNFRFEKTGETRVEGTNAWEISYREAAGPTVVRGYDGQNQFSYGTLWIEPETGRILKTEMSFGGRGSDLPYRVRMMVQYSPHRKLEMLVPTLMREHYETDTHTIEGRAEYTNFVRFEVDTKFELGTKPPPHN